MTTSVPAGTTETSSRLTARRRRRTRLRVTALPTDLLTMKPKRRASAVAEGRTCRTAPFVPTRRPRRAAVRKSTGRVTRLALASTVGDYAESSVRPLRRRAARMARPARVRMRSRKPCTLARRRLFGWKVLLLMVMLQSPALKSRKEVGGREAGSQLIKSTGLTATGQTFPASYTHSQNWGWKPQPVEN